MKVSKVIIVLIPLFLFQIDLHGQASSMEQRSNYPELEGKYEFIVPGTNPPEIELWNGYYKDGAFILIDIEDGERNSFSMVEGEELCFSRTFREAGTFKISFLKDPEEGQIQFRLQNELAKMDAIVKRIGDIEDAKADPGSSADRISFFERHYKKSEYMVPMRDGVKLYTQVFTPINSSGQDPIILYRTPYGISPYGNAFSDVTLPSLWFAQKNYILVYQEIRGTYKSEGNFEYLKAYIKDKAGSSDTDESSDAYDTVDWLLENIAGNNGRVGVWGSSYPGYTATMAAISGHPAIVAVSNQAPMSDLFLGDDGHHNGALYLAHYIDYLYSMNQLRAENEVTEGIDRIKYPSPDGYSYMLGLGTLKNITKTIVGENNFLWNQVMAHETYDEFWKSMSVYQHLKDIKPAMLTVGGWYDAEDMLGTFDSYKLTEKNNPGLENSIVIGPWRHSGWNLIAGEKDKMGVFPFKGTVRYFQEKIELPFFEKHLKDSSSFTLPEATVFETGTDKWRSFSNWPPIGTEEKKLFLIQDEQASFDSSLAKEGDGFDQYISDPARPVPYTATISNRYNKEYFVEDQRFASTRPDVLVYTSEILTDDLTITGPIGVELFVSTSGTDADWVVKVIDVYPDNSRDPKPNPENIKMGGYQRLIRGDIMRGKFRNSFENPEPFEPDKVTRVKFDLNDVQHTFLKGHRIMIQIQSSWFPLFDRNPQTFCNIRLADEKDFQKATHRIYRSSKYPSGITFNIITEER